MDFEQIKNIRLNFILATARTGSTLLVSMLNAHPNIMSTTEEGFAFSLYAKYHAIQNWTSDTIKDFCYDFFLFSEGRLEAQFSTKEELEALLETHKASLTYDIAIRITYLCFLPNKNKKEINVVVDKQLIFHFNLPKIAKFFPNSKFIILYRDPRDNAYTKHQMLSRVDDKQTYYRIANIWNFVYSTLREHKKTIGDERFIEVRYEDLVTYPDTELQKICSFINMPYTPSMLNYDEQIKNEEIFLMQLSPEKKYALSLLHESLTKKVNTDKVGYWKQKLTKDEANLVWTVSGKTAEEIGYKRHEDFIKQKLKLNDYINNLALSWIRAMTRLYYLSPFFVKHAVKTIKYGRKLKSSRYTSKVYSKRTELN